MAATQARAIQRTARQSPYKMRLVIDQIRGMSVNEALALLKFSKKHAAVQIAKVLNSAVANAEQAARQAGDSVDVDDALHHARHRERRSEAQAVHAGRAGTRHPDPQAHQSHRDCRRREGRTLMGQKTNPIGFRLGVTKQWRSRWFASKDYPKLVKEDDLLRKYLKTRLEHAAISDIHIERKPGKVVVTVHTGRPGVVIGKKGAEVDKLRDELAQLSGKEVGINVEEIKRPEVDAQLVADNVANQLAQRISFRRAMKRAVQSAMRMGAQGIKIKCSGRLGGAEIARVEGYHEGRVPLHTLRADIDYAHVHGADDVRRDRRQSLDVQG